MTKDLIPCIDNARAECINEFGGKIESLSPIGATVSDINLSAKKPPERVVDALEKEMAARGFIVFKGQINLEPEQFLAASCWWGGKEIHSTHSVHPETPGMNRNIFRLSNDQSKGFPGVGPQWHNDGSFNPKTFSHSGYHIIRPAEKGGGTSFVHQGAAFDTLPENRKAYWRRLSSVNSNNGVVHPLVHKHPISGRESVWLHLGMTGAVLDYVPERGFRLLDATELAKLCQQYNYLLNIGFEKGYAVNYEYEEGDCLFIDNLAVAHRAAPEAHLPPEQQGLRIMHRSTVKGVDLLRPRHDLPEYLNIEGPSPDKSGAGVWHSGGVGFRWQSNIPMQN